MVIFRGGGYESGTLFGEVLVELDSKKMKKYKRCALCRIPVVFVLFAIMALMLKFGRKNYSKFDSVIVLGKARTGSNLLTSLLSVHNFLYFMEPIYTTERNAHMKEDHSRVIAGLLTCNLPHIYWDTFTVQSYILHDLCDFQSDNFSCQTTRQMFCDLSKFTIIKTIQLNLEDAAKAIEISRVNAAILYLTRDPRAIMASRNEFIYAITGAKTLSDWNSNPTLLCNRINRELKFLNMNSSKDRFHFVKYEELVLHPTRVVKDIYKFLGRKYTASVEAIVKSKLEIKPEKSKFFNLVSTERDSKSRLELWRELLTFEEVSDIQSACQEVMEKLKYPFINQRQELRDHSLKLYFKF